MSRFGARPITIEEGVEVNPTPTKVVVAYGGKQLELSIPQGLTVKVEDSAVIVERSGGSKELRAQHGLVARLIRNMVTGIKNQFTIELEFTGTGYRAAVAGSDLVLNMGYSHEVRLAIPEGVQVSAVKNTIVVKGIEKEKVGEFAANIRAIRPPEVYKGKGIRYKNEVIRRKAGKTAASK
ncbi:MAG: 50S ribosomal protein L6 [bacterium ADurb.Bin400]|nr:MAG: 50S ribosomal protein L6 [bacterium ADurb.Bin400]